MKDSAIEWTDHTFNIAWGCAKISAGCKHCYAETLAKRYGHGVWGPDKPRRVMSKDYWRQPLKWDKDAYRAGKRARVFCSSMADVFEDHPTIDFERRRLWMVIRSTPNLDWLLLTKRAERIAPNLPPDWDEIGYPNVWLGVSAENYPCAQERIPHLLSVPARVRFLSAEPLLGPLHLDRLGDDELGTEYNALTGDYSGNDATGGAKLDWVIAGGESGPGARPMDPDWARALRDQCVAAGVAFFFKQWGGANKKAAGRLLDGREWSEMPRRAIS